VDLLLFCVSLPGLPTSSLALHKASGASWWLALSFFPLASCMGCGFGLTDVPFFCYRYLDFDSSQDIMF
jgi:hypothetical protein